MSTNVKINRSMILMIVGSWVFFFLFMRGCSGGISKGQSSDTHEETNITFVKQTKEKIIKVKPQIVYRDVPTDVQMDSVPYQDSTYCKEELRDCYTVNYYNDTVEDDTCRITYKARVTHNKIDSMEFAYLVKAPFQTITKQEYKPRVQVFLTGNVGPSFSIKDKNINGIAAGPEIIIKDKKNFIYGANANWNSTGDVTVQAKFGIMLSFRKH